MYHASAQGIDERMINVHYYDKCTLLLLEASGEIETEVLCAQFYVFETDEH